MAKQTEEESFGSSNPAEIGLELIKAIFMWPFRRVGKALGFKVRE